MKIKVSLSIGFPTATRADEIEIPDEEIEDCETEEEIEELKYEYCKGWMDNYVELWWE